MNVQVKFKGRVLAPHKAIVNPQIQARNVLTNEPWVFVSLWLKREKKELALFYWEQAYEFWKASKGLSLASAPLLLYYSYMNAVKALLSSKNIQFNQYHGVAAGDPHRTGAKSFVSETVKIKTEGVLPSLSQYYGELETRKTHSLQELFFNLPFIHRTYCLTYSSQTSQFLALKKCAYVYDKTAKEIFFVAELSKDAPLRSALNRLPASFKSNPEDGDGAIRSVASIKSSSAMLKISNMHNLTGLSKSLREDVFYINGSETLWYLKIRTSGPARIARQTPTIVLAAMHRLSELCRYRPHEMASFLGGQKNWLLSEFIRMSPVQFIDEISSEITGHQFLLPNVRSAT